jgi:prolyl oligopeptidase
MHPITQTGITVALLASLSACQPASKSEATVAKEASTTTAQEIAVTYPTTRKGDVVDTYFGTDVPDPYRWLEDDRSPETESWVKTQNNTTQTYLAQIPYKEQIGEVVREFINYERVSAPLVEGDYT